MTSLDARHIESALATRSVSCLERLEVFAEIDSTNCYLKDQPPPQLGKIRVAVADHQTSGRGRRQNQWHSAPGESLCLSVSYRFDAAPPGLPALTLALGVGLADALRGAGVASVQLKWPNDLLVNNTKVGGILTESVVRGDKTTVVIGVGLNIRFGRVREMVDASTWTVAAGSLADAMADMPPREDLAAMLIDSIASTVSQFAATGFAAVAPRFAAYDWLRGKSIEVTTADGLVAGHGAGVADDGALRVLTTGGERRVVAGSVTRASADRPTR